MSRQDEIRKSNKYNYANTASNDSEKAATLRDISETLAMIYDILEAKLAKEEVKDNA